MKMAHTFSSLTQSSITFWFSHFYFQIEESIHLKTFQDLKQSYDSPGTFFFLSFESQILNESLWSSTLGLKTYYYLNLHSVTVKADKTKVLSSSSYKLFHESSYSPLAERSAFRKIYPRVKCLGIVFYHSFQLSQSNLLNTKKGIMQWTKFTLHFVVFVHRTT